MCKKDCIALEPLAYIGLKCVKGYPQEKNRAKYDLYQAGGSTKFVDLRRRWAKSKPKAGLNF